MRINRWILAASFSSALVASYAAAHGGVTHSIEEFSEAIAETPSEAGLYLLRANEWRIEDRHDEALRDIARAKARGAGPEATLLEGRVLLEAGRPDEAAGVLQGHVATQPASPLGHWLLGRAYRLIGDFNAASRSYEHAAQLQASVDLFAERGAFLESVGDLQSAAANYTDALTRLESDLLRERLWRVELTLGRPLEAIAAITPVIERARLKTRWLVLRAQAYEVAGDRARARSDRERALREVDAALVKRRAPLLLVERARAHVALGDHAAALADAEEAATRAPHFEPATTLHDELRGAR